MSWSENLGRNRTKFGRWIDRKGVTQLELSKLSGISRPTITKLCGDDEYVATKMTKRSVLAALLKKGYDVEEHDFW